MKKSLIVLSVVTCMAGTAIAQDRVVVVRQNADSIKCADAGKTCRGNNQCPHSKTAKLSICKSDSPACASPKELTVPSGKSLKLDNAKKFPGKPVRMKQIRKHQK